MSNSEGLSLKDKREIKGLYQEVALMMKVAARNLKGAKAKDAYCAERWPNEDLFNAFVLDCCKDELSELLEAQEQIREIVDGR